MISMVNMAAIVVSEALCFFQNYYGKVPNKQLCMTLGGFYNETELVDAKKLLFDALESVCGTIEDRPRMKARTRAGEGRKKLEAEDMLEVFEFVDRKKKLLELPTFVAKSLRRIPIVSPSDADVYKLTESVTEMRNSMSSVNDMIRSLAEGQRDMYAKLETVMMCAPASTHSHKPPDDGQTTSSSTSEQLVRYHVEDHTEGHLSATTRGEPADKSTSFVDLFQTKDEHGNWFVVDNRKKKSLVVKRKITGRQVTSDVKIKAATPARPKTWHIFAGKLDPETTEEDMTDFLENSGITVVSCKLLEKREEWQHKFAAFHIAVDDSCKDKVFDEVEWPVGVDVRDWVFTKPSNV